jgi:DNA-binding transcriptional ArsR family regulator
MARFNFTPDDVARTRFMQAPAPVTETVLAMAELRGFPGAWGRRHRPGRWIREARAAFPATARPLLDLFTPCAIWPDFLDVFASDLEEGLEEVRATPPAVLRWELNYAWQKRADKPPTWVRNLADGDRESVELMVRAVHDLYQAVVAPRWDNAQAAFHADVASRISVLGAGGPEAMFGTLHPRLRWDGDGLERTGFDGEYSLNGHGMILMPSAFWAGDPVFSLNDGTSPSVLMYAAQPNGPLAGDGFAADPAAADSLAALVGPTRAAVLRALGKPRGTADLATTVGVSPATASEHAKVLRDASLIETRREGRTVRHSLTALGRTIVGQLPPASNGRGAESAALRSG